MKEFTLRAVLLGLVMCVILGAANAYLGLKSGVTIAATYPAAVIGMAVLRIWKGSVLEENIARTAGSIGESVAAGAIFTLPAFVISGAWSSFDPGSGLLEIHRDDDGRQHSGRAVRLAGPPRDGGGSFACRSRNRWPPPRFTRPDSAAPKPRATCSGTSEWAPLVQLLGAFSLFAVDKDIPVPIGELGTQQRAPGSRRQHEYRPDRRRSRCSPVPPSAPPTWASAT